MSWNGTASPVTLTPITIAFYETNIAENLDDHQVRLVAAEGAIDDLEARFPITTADLQAGAVTAPKLGLGAVGFAQLGDGQVAEQKILDGAVTTPKLADAGVTTQKLNDGAVTTPKMPDGAVTNAKLAGLIDLSTKAADGSLTGAKVAAHTIDGDDKLVESSVTGNASTSAIGVESIDANRLVSGSMVESEVDRVFAAGSIDDTRLKAGVAVANLGFTPARAASGSYTGNGSSSGRQITTGFAVKFFWIRNITQDTVFVSIDTSGCLRIDNDAPQLQFQSAVHVHASDGFTVADGSTSANINSESYVWSAFG